MTDCKLKGSPETNSKKIYGIIKYDGISEGSGTSVAKTGKSGMGLGYCIVSNKRLKIRHNK